MFVLRSLFWLGTVVMLLPASPHNPDLAPRVNLLHTAYAARVLLEDVSGMCERNPQACATSREALVLLTQKLETGASIVGAGIASGRSASAAAPVEQPEQGTLTENDLAPAWSFAVVTAAK